MADKPELATQIEGMLTIIYRELDRLFPTEEEQWIIVHALGLCLTEIARQGFPGSDERFEGLGSEFAKGLRPLFESVLKDTGK
jgi:hypothetical protein